MMVAPSHENAIRLSELLRGIVPVADCDDCLVTGIQLDSRNIESGDLFLACRGSRVHGASHLGEALQRGAAAVIYDPEGANGVHPLGIPAVAVEELSERLGELAGRFYGFPSSDLQVIGITGTNGKTSCSHYLAQALNRPTAPCGIVGTAGSGLFGALEASPNTTPDAVAIHSALASFRLAGAKEVVMEVSSHALDQGRVKGVAFNTAVFTNLAHDHLDYHGDMEAYESAKRRLFTWPGLESIVVNVDDAAGRRLIREISAPVAVAYGLNAEAVTAAPAASASNIKRLWAEEVRLEREGFSIEVAGTWGSGTLRAPLPGRFNASNLMAVLAVLLVEGWALEKALQRLAETLPVPGRMERFGAAAGPQMVVDYAHTPGALQHALTALHEHCEGDLWCVFGCGGDRDRGKRPLMGRIAEQWAQHLVITDDNPRSENGDDIIRDILDGLQHSDAATVERDRDAAIRMAFERAANDDLILVAGKGHEEYQEVAGKRLEQSDRAVAVALTEGSG